MEPEYLNLQTIILGITGFLAILYVKNMDRKISDAKELASSANAKIHTIEVLVAGNYVKKEEHDKMAEAMFKKLDRIEDKLDDAPCRVSIRHNSKHQEV